MSEIWDWKEFKKWIWIAFLVILILTIVGFIFGWITLPIDKGSRDNVEKQFRRGYELYESLQATAQMVCTAEQAYNETDPNTKQQRQTQLTAYQTNYQRLAAEYDAWARNVFEGGIIHPQDLPTRAPTLQDMKSQVCK